MRRRLAGLAALASMLLLAGCATVPPPAPQVHGAESAWQMHRQRLSAVERFALAGRVASAELDLRADLRWRQQADGRFELRLAGPLGAGAVELRGDDQAVEVRNKEGSQVTADPEGWIRKRYGWTLPLRNLRHWVLGVPRPDAPEQHTLDAAGRLATLEQDGWQLRYDEYRRQGEYDLPRRFEASNGRVKLKLFVDRWDAATPY